MKFSSCLRFHLPYKETEGTACQTSLSARNSREGCRCNN